MWVLVAISLVTTYGWHGGVTSVNTTRFYNEKACLQAAQRILAVEDATIKGFRIAQGKIRVFCVHDDPTPELEKQLKSLER